MKPVAIKDWSTLADRVPAHALVADVDLVIVRVDESVRVLYGRCAHRGALMADGYVDGENLICGVHDWDYRLDSGVSEYNNSETLATFTAWVEDGRVLVDEGQGDYVWGHISMRLPDDPSRFLMKPGCIGVEEMTHDNIITVDIEGDKVLGEWPRHNEVYIHSEVLRARPEINCVIHTHTRAGVAVSVMKCGLLPISQHAMRVQPFCNL